MLQILSNQDTILSTVNEIFGHLTHAQSVQQYDVLTRGFDSIIAKGDDESKQHAIYLKGLFNLLNEYVAKNRR